jgi:hypothetical protein
LGILGATFGFGAPAFGEPPEGREPSEASAKQGAASVSVGVVAARRDVRSELGAFVGLALPLERWAAPRAVPLAVTDAFVLSTDADDEGPPASDASDPAASADRGAVTAALAPELLARLARDAVAAAENARHAAEHERDLDGVAARARYSAVLPEVRLRAARSRDDSLKQQPTLDDPYRYSTVGGDGLWLEAQATFHLNRLLFADEEVAVERLRIARERVGEERAVRVARSVVRWHRALSRERSVEDAAERGRAALERIDAEVELDVLTDGWFGQRLRQLGLRAPRAERHAGAPRTPAAPASGPETPVRPPKTARAGLDARSVSATSASPCLPKLATDSKTFCGALTR